MIRLFLLLGCWLTLSLQAEVELTIRTLPGMPVHVEGVYPFVVEMQTASPVVGGKLVATLGGADCVVELPIETGAGRFRYHLVMPVMPEIENHVLTVRLEVEEATVAIAEKGIFAPRADWRIALLAPPDVLQQAALPRALAMTPQEVQAAMAPYTALDKEVQALYTEMKAVEEDESDDWIFAPEEPQAEDLSEYRKAKEAGTLTLDQLMELAAIRRRDDGARELFDEIVMELWQQGDDHLRQGAEPLWTYPRVVDPSLVPVPDPELLPIRWYGYMPLDVVVWERPASGVLTYQQLAALKEWIRYGGRLVCLGAREEQVRELGFDVDPGFGEVIVREESWGDLLDWPRDELLELVGGPPDERFVAEHEEVMMAALMAGLHDTSSWPAMYELLPYKDLYPYSWSFAVPPPDLDWTTVWWAVGVFLLVAGSIDLLLARRARRRRWVWIWSLVGTLALSACMYQRFYRQPVAEPLLMEWTLTDLRPGFSRTWRTQGKRRVADPVRYELAPGVVGTPVPNPANQQMLIPNGETLEEVIVTCTLLNLAELRQHEPAKPSEQPVPVSVRLEDGALTASTDLPLVTVYVIWRGIIYAGNQAEGTDYHLTRRLGLANGLLLNRSLYGYGRPNFMHETLTDVRGTWVSGDGSERVFPRRCAWREIGGDLAMVILVLEQESEYRAEAIRVAVPVERAGGSP